MFLITLSSEYHAQFTQRCQMCGGQRGLWLCACDRFALAEFELSLLFPADCHCLRAAGEAADSAISAVVGSVVGSAFQGSGNCDFWGALVGPNL